MASIQRISQLEDQYYKNIVGEIKQSNSSKERISLYDIILTETELTKEYENILEEILKKYLIDADEQQFNRFTELSILLGKWEISISDFRIILEQEFDISINSTDIEVLQKESIAYIDEQDAYLIRLISQTQVLESNLETAQQLIIQNIVTQIQEQVQNISEEEIEEITTRITEFFTQEWYIFSLEEFMLLLQSISNDYSVELSYKELIESYIDYEEILVLLQEYISQISYIESEIPLLEYQTLIEQFTIQVESLWETQSLFETITLEEIQSYFETELSYGDLEILLKERQESLSTLSDVTSAYLDDNTFRDDSELLKDMRPIAYIEKIEWSALVRNLYDSAILWSSNQLLYAWYSIETLPWSTLTIVFHDDSLLRMEEGSRITLIGEREEIRGIKIEYGNIWARIIKPFFSWESFEIEWERVSLAVRGTSIYMEKNGDNENIYIIDTVANTEQSGVVLQDKTNWNSYNLSSWKSIVSNYEWWDITINDTPRLWLLESKSNISWYIQEDLRYMSLLLDDRKRWFFNTPFWNTDAGENFLNKVSAEIEASLPTQSEKWLFFRSPELINHISSSTISSENIYELIIKDDLIETIKTYQSPVQSQKIEEVLNLDVTTVLDSLGNKRAIEDRIKSNIVDEILESVISIEEVLIRHDIDEVYDIRRRLNNAYDALEIPGWNVRLTQNISLPWQMSSDSQILLIWTLENDTPFASLSNTQGSQLLQIEQPINADSIKTTLQVELSLEWQTRKKYLPFIVPSRDYTDSEKLDIASETLSNYILLYTEFTDSIILPRFNAYDSIIPQIEWIPDWVVNRDGTLNRPEYSENDTANHQARAKLSFWDASKDDFTVTLKNIRKKPLIPEEIAEKYAIEILEDSRFPWCNTPDIALPNGQVWAMCNVGSTMAGVSSQSYGKYLGFSNARWVCPSWYKAPNRNDWKNALSQFDSFSDMQTTMLLPRAGYNSSKGVWIDTYFWTTDKKWFLCPSNCGYAIKNWNEVGMKHDFVTSWDELSVRCLRWTPHIFEDEEEEITEVTTPVEEITVIAPELEAQIETILPEEETQVTLEEIVQAKQINIWWETYTLVASAEYDTDLFLRDPAWNLIGQMSKWAWLTYSNNGELQSSLKQYPAYGNISTKESIDHNLSLVNVDGQTGVLMSRSRADSYLSYNLQDLNLWEDWAIEMSVRGEDLGRSNWFYSLLHIPSVVKIYDIMPNNQIPDSWFWIIWNTLNNYHFIWTSFSNWYKKVKLIKQWNNYTIDVEWNTWRLQSTWLSNNIFIWSNSWNTEQWNWIIDNVKIYKKE